MKKFTVLLLAALAFQLAALELKIEKSQKT